MCSLGVAVWKGGGTSAVCVLSLWLAYCWKVATEFLAFKHAVLEMKCIRNAILSASVLGDCK